MIEPVILQPLRRRWAEIKNEVTQTLEPVILRPALSLSKSQAAQTLEPVILSKAKDPERVQPAIPTQSFLAQTKARAHAEELMSTWFDELTAVRVLDPACGSGNFLYIALQQLMNLWKEARDFASENGLAVVRPGMVSPRQLYGIETDFYAHEIASVVVWIGWLQWMHEHGEPVPNEPILQKLDNIQHADAILRYDPKGKPYEPKWPEAEYIVSNPPFLGDKKMRRELNTPAHPAYVDDLRLLYRERVPGGADLVAYWFEKARLQIEIGSVQRVGLLATNSISMVRNRPVLERIKKTGDFFMVWSDQPWTLEGAAVRVALLAFDDGSDKSKVLDGLLVTEIHSDLTSEANLSDLKHLSENEGICFLGMMKAGPFDLTPGTAEKMLSAPVNINERPNSDVVKRRIGSRDLTDRDRNGWVIDFGVAMSGIEAAKYEVPFEYVRHTVKPLRDQNNRKRLKERWWIHGEARPGLRKAAASLERCIATPEVSKYRIFCWIPTSSIPDHKLHVFARDDDYFFGVLHSKAHETWTIATCSWIGKGNDPSYNSATTFETFPFPWPPGKEPQDDPRVQAIAAAAKNLVELRDGWLNPPDTPDDELARRTLTNLYNKRPQWLDDAHRALDQAVFAAYGWPDDLTDQQILERLLALNHQRAAAQQSKETGKRKKQSTHMLNETSAT